MRVAPHTQVRAARIAEYEAAHREAPKEHTDAVRAAGAASRQARRAGPPAVAHDSSGAGAAACLPVGWELP